MLQLKRWGKRVRACVWKAGGGANHHFKFTVVYLHEFTLSPRQNYFILQTGEGRKKMVNSLISN